MSGNSAELDEWRERAHRLETLVGQVVIGQPRVIRLLTIATFARGHVLLQGDVGVGKTTLLRAFAHLIGGAFARVEGTIDLIPNDLIYYTHIGADGRPQVDPGPLLQHGEALSVFFFNEINRARPQVHSLLLRVMAERSIQAFNREHRFPHILVFADRNRLEREETFEVSSAARDRFMMEIAVEPPQDDAQRRELSFSPRFHDVDALIAELPAAILAHQQLNAVAAAIQQHIGASDALQQYALDLWRASAEPQRFGIRIDGIDSERLMLAGASPRGMSMLLRAARVAAWLDSRDYVTPEDLQAVFAETIGHRLCFQPIHELRRAEISMQLLRGIIDRVAAP
jgi:MoxR-like ATPase